MNTTEVRDLLQECIGWSATLTTALQAHRGVVAELGARHLHVRNAEAKGADGVWHSCGTGREQRNVWPLPLPTASTTMRRDGDGIVMTWHQDEPKDHKGSCTLTLQPPH